MPSPFPGMDPYIEGQFWTDFHHEFISQMRAVLMPQLTPHYAAHIEERVYIDRTPSSEIRWFRPRETRVNI